MFVMAVIGKFNAACEMYIRQNRQKRVLYITVLRPSALIMQILIAGPICNNWSVQLHHVHCSCMITL